MRAGVLISAISHVVLVLLALLGTPKLFDSTIPSITVELVPREEIEHLKDAPEPEKPEPEKEKPPQWGLAAAENAPQPEPVPSAPPPDNTRQALLPQQPQQAAPGTGGSAPSVFDPAAIPMLLDLPNAPERGFDTEATRVANLSAEERAAFKAQLRKCWKLPGSPNQATRVVLRIYLRRDARLAGEPVLIEASASRDGPAVMQAALRALKECQPFAFLPPEKYAEWKILDLSFTPREMGGG